MLRRPLLLLALAAACTTAGPRRAELDEGLGGHHVPVSTASPLAQRWFDQGMAWCYGFHHDEAVRSFDEALRVDPGLAMAHWGKALALGPNYNQADEGEARARQALDELALAAAAADAATPLERDLIAALQQRFAWPHPRERGERNRAYSGAMRALWRRYPENGEVGFLLADALLNEHPWDQWDRDGTPKRDTLELVAVLERVLALDPDHPGANHMYVHAVEASPDPGRAVAAADRLLALAPAAGHLVHMASHIYMRMGRYADAAEANRRAVAADRAFFARTGTRQSRDPYHGYHMHNHKFLVWALLFLGRADEALRQCDAMEADMPVALADGPNMADEFAARYHVLVRFGRWDEAWASPPPPHGQPFAVAMWRYARGIAAANLGRLDDARAEAAAFAAAAANVPAGQRFHVVPAADVLAIARAMLAGETAWFAGDADGAFAQLRAAVAAEDALRYTEPSPWMMPARHALGALLLQHGDVADAERVYRDDLALHPDNGWALHGLGECLERRGAAAEAAAARSCFARAWAGATVAIPGSCFCRTR